MFVGHYVCFNSNQEDWPHIARNARKGANNYISEQKYTKNII